MSNEIAVYTPPPSDVGHPLFDPNAFTFFAGVARMLAMSNTLPPHLCGPNKISTVHAILAIAKSRGEEPILLAQSTFEVHGRIDTHTDYLIARANDSGIDLDWDIVRRDIPFKFARSVKGGESRPAEMEDLTVTCYGEIRGKRREIKMSSADALRNKWPQQNEAYSKDAALMLRYRTAKQLLKLYAPAIVRGLPSSDREDSEDATPAVAAVVVPDAPVPAPKRRTAAEAIDALPHVDEPGDRDTTPPRVAPPLPSPSPTSPPPSQGVAASGDGPEPAPKPAPKPAPPPPNPANDAMMIRAGIDLSSPVSVQACADALKAASGLERVRGERVRMALDRGQASGWWAVTGDMTASLLTCTVSAPVVAPVAVVTPVEPDEVSALSDQEVSDQLREVLDVSDLDELSSYLDAAGITDYSTSTPDQRRALLRALAAE